MHVDRGSLGGGGGALAPQHFEQYYIYMGLLKLDEILVVFTDSVMIAKNMQQI